MKKLTMVHTMQGDQNNFNDAYIQVRGYWLKDTDGKSPIWVNKVAGICKWRKKAWSVVFYEPVPGTANQFIQVALSADAILRLADEIKAINEEIFEDTID